VRHALGRLSAERLVELRRNRGATVATPSWKEACGTSGSDWNGW
jgi:DNA-binding GntR family transcriptional regulator